MHLCRCTLCKRVRRKRGKRERDGTNEGNLLTHVFPSGARVYPCLQPHSYPPIVLMQECRHPVASVWRHSSLSEIAARQNTPPQISNQLSMTNRRKRRIGRPSVQRRFHKFYLDSYISPCLYDSKHLWTPKRLNAILNASVILNTIFNLAVWLSIYLSDCLSVCLSVCVSVCLTVCLYVYLYVYLSICMSICLSASFRSLKTALISLGLSHWKRFWLVCTARSAI